MQIALSLAVFVAVSYGHEGPAGHTHPEDAAVVPLDAKPAAAAAAEAVALKPAIAAVTAEAGRPKRQFGLGLLLGSALGGGYGYGRPYGYGGYGGYGRPYGYGGYGHGYGHHHHGHHGHHYG